MQYLALSSGTLDTDTIYIINWGVSIITLRAFFDVSIYSLCCHLGKSALGMNPPYLPRWVGEFGELRFRVRGVGMADSPGNA